MAANDTIDLRHEIKRCPECKERFRPDAGFCPFDGVALVPDRYVPPLDPLVGTIVDDRYEVVGVLGEGGMGTVYEVRHTTLGRRAALKALRADLAQEGELAARFLQEAQATAAIKHPSVVSILDFGRLRDARPYFVMELLSGQTVADAIHRGGPAPVAMAVAIGLRVAEALEAAHAAGIVHRDLKPENVYLVGGAKPDPDVRVVDFGAAMILGKSRLTKKGVVFGTPHYMSPEQAAGKTVDHRTDVYSLGILLYEMLTGKVPFEGDTYMGILTQHMFAEPTPPSTVRPERASELGILEAVVLRALAKEPADRFPSMHDFAVALQAALTPSRTDAKTDPPLLPRKPSAPRPATEDLQLPTTTEIQHAIDEAAPPKRRWARVVALAALTASLVIVVVAVALRRGHSEPEAARPSPPPPPVVSAPSAVTTAQPTARRVVLSADADGDLFLGAALVGPLPATVIVEPGAPAKTYTIRARGYVAQDVRVDEGSRDSIDVRLTREASVPKPTVTAARTATPSATAPPTMHGSPDLYDPWKN